MMNEYNPDTGQHQRGYRGEAPAAPVGNTSSGHLADTRRGANAYNGKCIRLKTGKSRPPDKPANHDRRKQEKRHAGPGYHLTGRASCRGKARLERGQKGKSDAHGNQAEYQGPEREKTPAPEPETDA
jgi:hypothetical protein